LESGIDAGCATVITARSHDGVIRVFDEVGNVIETHQHAGESVSGAHLRFRAAKPLNGWGTRWTSLDRLDLSGWDERIRKSKSRPKL